MIKLIALIIFCTIPALSHGGEVEADGVKWTYHDDWGPLRKGTKDYKSKPIPSGTTVYAMRFDAEQPNTEVFHPDMTGVTFLWCHLNNVALPAGNTIIGPFVPYEYETLNDLRDWKLDAQGQPEKLIDEEYWIKEGYSTDPKDIPIKKIDSTDKIPKAAEIIP